MDWGMVVACGMGEGRLWRRGLVISAGQGWGAPMGKDERGVGEASRLLIWPKD